MQQSNTGFFAAHYKVLRSISTKPGAEIYIAEDVRNGQMVAIREISSELPAGLPAREHFGRDFAALARTRHPNLVHVLEFIDHPDYKLQITEYVEGRTLAEFLYGGRVVESEAVLMMLQIANGLAAIHQLGFVHRELRPDRIIICADGFIKIDGIGFCRSGSLQTIGSSNDFVERAKYFAPEFIEGARADQQSDLYVLGAIGYELLGGASPFRASSADQVIPERSRTTFAEDLSVLAPDSSSEIRRILAKALSANLAMRYPDIGSFIGELRRVLPPHPITRAKSEAMRLSGIYTVVPIEKETKQVGFQDKILLWTALVTTAAAVLATLVLLLT